VDESKRYVGAFQLRVGALCLLISPGINKCGGSVSPMHLHLASISFSHIFVDWLCAPRRPTPGVTASLLGQIRTATKRAGGTIKNHGGSAGRRLGVKKFSGMFYLPCYRFSASLIISLQTSLLLPVQLSLDREVPNSILASMSVPFHAFPLSRLTFYRC